MAKGLAGKNAAWVPLETASVLTSVDEDTILNWEDLFSPHLKPQKVGGERRYSRSDLETIVQIRRLIRDSGFGVLGVRKALAWSMRRAA